MRKVAHRDSVATIGMVTAGGLWSALIVICVSFFTLPGPGSARQAAGSQPSAPASHRPAPPLAVARTDELYKPATLPDGRLVAAALPTVEGVQRVVAIYSRDNGHTWGEPSTLFSLPREEGSFGYFNFMADRAGEMHLFFLVDPSTGAKWRRTHPQATAPEARLDIWHIKSTGGGTAWPSPKRIWEGRAGDMLSVVQLRSGRILLPICYRTDRNWARRGDGFDAYTYHGQFDSSVLYSDDGGESWRQSPSALRTPTPDITTILGAVEPVVLQLKDGRAWMLIRTQMGRFYESYSADDGKTWTPPVPTSLISSDSPAGLVRLPDGRIVMILNRTLRFPYAYGGRHVLHAAISDDDGRTWHGYREVVRDPLRGQPPPPDGDFGPSYPYPTLTQDGKVLFATACATGTRGGQPHVPGFVSRQKRDLILLDPAWLTEISQRTDFSGGLDDWSAFGVKGVELVPHPARPGARVLGIRKTEPAWPAAAVWNFPMGARGHVRLNLMLKPGFGGALVGLTDHYSVPFDGEDTFYNVYNVAIGPDGELTKGGKLEPNRWHQLDLDWDTIAGNARILADGKQVALVRAKRESEGVSYLRLCSTASGVDLSGFLVESVEAKISPGSQR